MPITDLIPWNRNRNMPDARQADPFVALRREMDRVFDSFFRGFDLPMTGNPGWSVGTWPHAGVSETDNEVKLVAELPGMEEKDVELNLNEGRPTLKGARQTETHRAGYSERWHGQVQPTAQPPGWCWHETVAARIRATVSAVHRAADGLDRQRRSDGTDAA